MDRRTLLKIGTCVPFACCPALVPRCDAAEIERQLRETSCVRPGRYLIRRSISVCGSACFSGAQIVMDKDAGSIPFLVVHQSGTDAFIVGGSFVGNGESIPARMAWN